jgi:hypothetical protein
MKTEVPSKSEFLRGVQKYERDATYKVVQFYIEKHWDNPPEMTYGLVLFLYSWNSPFYRFGGLSYDMIESCIRDNLEAIDKFKTRSILTFSEADEREVSKLFLAFLKATKRSDGAESPVSASKSLHLFAPDFFPAWDRKIANAYGCNYNNDKVGAYIRFCWLMMKFAEKVNQYNIEIPDRTLLKAIDEYNYAKFTRRLI